jgi:Predicted flavin-nucleotide-binding protein
MPTPLFEEMDREQCNALLERSHVGRLAFSLHDAVDVVPIGFTFKDGRIYGRTNPGGKLATLDRNRRIAFEVDEFTGPFEWKSVVIHGSFYVLDAGADETRKQLAGIFPEAFRDDDPAAFRNQFFSISVDEMSGRSAAPDAGVRKEAVGGDRLAIAADPERDQKLRNRIVAEIQGLLPQNNIRCAVEDGVAILTGSVRDAHVRSAVEALVAAIDGVGGIVQQIDVEWPVRIQLTPAEVAREASQIVNRSVTNARTHVVAVYESGWIRLEGQASEVERQRIWSSIQHVAGSHGVIDRIRISESTV